MQAYLQSNLNTPGVKQRLRLKSSTAIVKINIIDG